MHNAAMNEIYATGKDGSGDHAFKSPRYSSSLRRNSFLSRKVVLLVNDGESVDEAVPKFVKDKEDLRPDLPTNSSSSILRLGSPFKSLLLTSERDNADDDDEEDGFASPHSFGPKLQPTYEKPTNADAIRMKTIIQKRFEIPPEELIEEEEPTSMAPPPRTPIVNDESKDDDDDDQDDDNDDGGFPEKTLRDDVDIVGRHDEADNHDHDCDKEKSADNTGRRLSPDDATKNGRPVAPTPDHPRNRYPVRECYYFLPIQPMSLVAAEEGFITRTNSSKSSSVEATPSMVEEVNNGPPREVILHQVVEIHSP